MYKKSILFIALMNSFFPAIASNNSAEEDYDKNFSYENSIKDTQQSDDVQPSKKIKSSPPIVTYNNNNSLDDECLNDAVFECFPGYYINDNQELPQIVPLSSLRKASSSSSESTPTEIWDMLTPIFNQTNGAITKRKRTEPRKTIDIAWLSEKLGKVDIVTSTQQYLPYILDKKAIEDARKELVDGCKENNGVKVMQALSYLKIIQKIRPEFDLFHKENIYKGDIYKNLNFKTQIHDNYLYASINAPSKL